jgi:anti-sigma B factor antagonist
MRVEQSGEEQLTLMRGIIAITEGLEIAIDHGEESSIVRLRGRLNIDSSPALRDQLLAMLQAQSTRAVIVDFSDVSYVDSSGIATVIEGLGMARLRQTTLCLQGVQGRLLHLFQVIGISALFEKNGCGSASSVSQVS